MSDQSEYPPGVEDRDGYDAMTYLEGGTEEAMAAAARMDLRAAARAVDPSGLVGRTVRMNAFCSRETKRGAELDLYAQYGAALGFSRERALEILEETGSPERARAKMCDGSIRAVNALVALAPSAVPLLLRAVRRWNRGR